MRKNSSVAFSLNAKINFKLIVVGNKNAGKTSLILRFIKNEFNFNYSVTIGVEFYSKILQHGEDQIALQIWDTSGSDNHKSIVRSFYNFSNCVMLVYDSPANMKENIQNWVYEINEHVMEEARLVLVRTKIDLIPIGAEEQNLAQDLKEKFGFDIFVGVSAKNGTNVQNLFTQIGKGLQNLYDKSQQFRKIVDYKSNSVVLSLQPKVGKKKDKRSKCCF